MAVSTCVKCSGHSFELVLLTPLGEARKLTIVQCSAVERRSALSTQHSVSRSRR